jgi:hypothetical protein
VIRAADALTFPVERTSGPIGVTRHSQAFDPGAEVGWNSEVDVLAE